MSLINAAIDLTSAAFMLIILYATIPRGIEMSPLSNRFRAMVIVTLLSLLVDGASWMLEGRTGIELVQYPLNFFAMIGGEGIVILFGYYEDAMVAGAQDGKSSKWFLKLIVLLNLGGMLLTLLAALSGKMYTFENGLEVRGELYWVMGITVCPTLLIGIVFAFIKRKCLGKHDTWIVVAYVVFPVIGYTVDIVFEGICTALAFTAAACLFIYIEIQSLDYSKVQVQADLYEKMSGTDLLTGLGNRRSYNLAQEEIDSFGSTGIVFCDLNGLKRINDTEGHLAGDQRIVFFADMLKKHFPKESLFRISGDEFVIVLKNIREEYFNQKIEELRKDSVDNQWIAAIGAAYGAGCLGTSLVNQAENLMYQDKAKCHQLLGFER